MHRYIVTVGNIAHVNPRCVREFILEVRCLALAWELAERSVQAHEMVMAVVPYEEEKVEA